MKILMITADFFGRGSGGIAQYVYNASKRLSMDKHQVEIITPMSNPEVIIQIEKCKIKIHDLEITPNSYFSQYLVSVSSRLEGVRI